MTKITLISAEGERLEISEAAAMKSKFIVEILEDCKGDSIDIPLSNVGRDQLEVVVKFCEFYSDKGLVLGRRMSNRDLLKLSDMAREILTTGREKICEIVKIADFMDIEPLVKLCCAKLAADLREMDTEEIYETFKIPRVQITKEIAEDMIKFFDQKY